MLRKLVLWSLVFSMFFGAVGARAASGFSGDPVAVEKAAQSVLMLEVYNQGELIATGSGFVAFGRDMLVTNSHVIDGADEILAKSDQGDEYALDKIYAVDAKKDLAILGFSSPTDLPPLTARTNGGVMRVEPVVAIGSPKGLLNTVSVGNVSALYTEEGTRYIQFTAPVSSGSSGGALFDNNGEVVGITTSVLSDSEDTVQNLNFAIHISEAAALWEKVDGRAWIPVQDYPAFQKTGAGFPGDAQAAYEAGRYDIPLAFAAVFALFSPCIAFLKVPPRRAQPSQSVPESGTSPLQSYAISALKRDKAYAFDVEWVDLETVREGYNYFIATVREGSSAYTLYVGLSEDGVSDGVFVMDADDSLLKDGAYIAILRDLGDAFIRASGGDDDGLVKNLRDFNRRLDGYKTGKKGEAFELYGDIAYFQMQYDEADAQNPAGITLAFLAFSPLDESVFSGAP